MYIFVLLIEISYCDNFTFNEYCFCLVARELTRVSNMSESSLNIKFTVKQKSI